MAMDRSGVSGWKQTLINWLDNFYLRIPFLTEFFNQGLSKNMGLLAAWHFLSRVEVEGDYLEFGVFRGETFRNAILAARQGFRGTISGKFDGRFMAFDSFQGLPETESMREPGNIYAQGEFSASRAVFEKTIFRARKNATVFVTEGWFDHILTPQLQATLELKKIAFANIDCDLYESTVPVLEFITPFLQTGTIIYFDDWFSLKGDMKQGEALACEEWLRKYPQIKLVEYKNPGITGKMFIVNLAH